MRILVFDPGDHTGWVFKCDDPGNQLICGGTVETKSLEDIEALFAKYTPNTVVYETFQLYAGAAKSLIHNEFYTIQVIGAIKLLCIQRKVTFVIGQAPSVKKFAGDLDLRWVQMPKKTGVTEHIKDAYLHLKYFEKFGISKLPL